MSEEHASTTAEKSRTRSSGSEELLDGVGPGMYGQDVLEADVRDDARAKNSGEFDAGSSAPDLSEQALSEQDLSAQDLNATPRQTDSGLKALVQTNPGLGPVTSSPGAPTLAAGEAGVTVDASVDELSEGVTNLSGRLVSERYLIGKCLGFGGMGTVWRAEHTLMKKTVAVKVLHTEAIGYGEAVERFRREAQAAAHINHPNVCVATDFGEMEDEGFFLVMEYLEGTTLDKVVAEAGRLSPRRAIAIVDQILAALSQAHELGVVHRDLKPENIMLVEREGNPDFVKIMDFGIARVPTDEEQGDARLTRVGRVYGTPIYMPPEQASGTVDVDQRADLYAVGVILFEMLSGGPPFMDKSSAKVMAMHLTEPAPSVRERVPEARIPRALDQLIQSLMAKDPAERPATAEAVRASLETIATRGGRSLVEATRDITNIMSRPAGLGADGGRRGVFTRARLLTVVGLAALAIVLVITLPFFRSNPPDLSAKDRGELSQLLSDQRLRYLDEIEASDVINTMAMGNSERAIERLRELIDEHEPNAHLYFLHGRASAGAEDWGSALASYRQALELKPEYAAVERLIDDVLEPFSAGEEEEHEVAERILIDQLPIAETNRKLSFLARLGENSSVRRRAYNALKGDGRLDDLEAWNRASIALRFANGCRAHRDHIHEIVDAEDPRGLEVLRYYQDYRRTGCGRRNQEDCYGCIRKDLDEAILAIERQFPPDEEPLETSLDGDAAVESGALSGQ